ncbi:hypothetical protein RND81_11G026300 [Saponaria officinalis]|uniref:Glycosyltransferase family 92 protein n=1 Tax=Saponaria officinalis TaxID=3572 RepID=A0AAW1HIT2_SAPOF
MSVCVSMDVRKRKRILKGSSSHINQFFTAKFLLLCFGLFGVFTLLRGGFSSGPFRPAPIVRKLAGFSSSVSYSVQDLTNHHVTDSDEGVEELVVEDRVVFSDHVLVILLTNGKVPRVQQRIDCVYHKQLTGSYGYDKGEVVTYPMMSADEYGEERWIVWCPPPPPEGNYSTTVGLRGLRDDMLGFEWVAGMRERNQTAKQWDMLAYDAVFDGEDTVAVFVKGLRLRSDRESDPSYFSCHFKKKDDKNEAGVTSKAIKAAQEVIRCQIPSPVRENLKNNEVVQVSVIRNRMHKVFPSIAKLQQNNVSENENYNKNKGRSYKYELCGCSMVWNQAAFIKEWIAYHAWLGVQRWFVYDNNSDDGLKEVIDELDEVNYNVTRHVWPWVKSQEAGFSHCVLRARDECRWVGFFDVDEFYYFPPPKYRNKMIGDPGAGSLRAVVDNVTLTAPSIGEIRTDCYSFGPSGLKKSPEEGVTLGYTCRMRNPERHKSIVRPDAVDDTLLNQVHHFKLKKEFRKTTLPQSKALINHYKYQVWDVFKSKFYRRVSTYVADWQENQNENSRDRAPGLGTEAIEPADWHKRFCEVWDTRLRDFILANLGDPDTGLVSWV